MMLRTSAALAAICAMTFAAAAQQPPDPNPAPPPPPPPTVDITKDDNPVPPPPPPPVEVKYWVSENGQATGPFTPEQIAEKVMAKTVTAQTYVLKAGTQNWITAGTAPDLKTAIAAVPPAPPAQEKFQTYMAGNWRLGPYQDPQTGGTVVIDVIYMPNGQFNGVATIQFPAMSGIQTPPQQQAMGGTWKVASLGDDRFSLTLVNQAGGMTQNNTVVLRVIDENTMMNESMGQTVTRMQ